jgi:predicted membrane-bound spermidine synthase
MAGLTLGNALVSSYGDCIGRFLRTYAALEGAVAITGILMTYALRELTGALASVTRSLVDSIWLVNLLRLVMAFLILMVPTTAMGATLPVLVGALCGGRQGFGEAVGRLYGWNTLGAVVGVVGTEVMLIGRFGVTGAAWIAAVLSLSATAAAAWLSARTGGTRALAPRVMTPVALSAAAKRLLGCAFLAGGCLMALEVVWFRFLSLFVISSSLTVSLTLAVVLAAIGIGGLAASRRLKRRPAGVASLPVVALMACVASIVSYVTFQYFTDGAAVAEWHRILWFALVLTFPTSLLSGVLFTLIGDALQRHIPNAARAAGWLTLANTTGAACGPLLAAFLLLPFLGMERALFALAFVYGAIGLLAIRNDLPREKPARLAIGISSVAAVVVLALYPFGLMATTYFARAAKQFTDDGEEVLATREGTTATVFLMSKAWMGVPTYYRLVTNGFSMSGTMVPARRYMSYFVYWPMVVHEAPLRRVLVICYGVGNTVGAARDIDAVESIDVVDTSREVVDTSAALYSAVGNPLRDRRVKLHLEDGRYFLQQADQRFDLITGEPPPPYSPDIVNLYTREYFRLIYDRLTEGGITTYWLPVSEVDFRSITRAFCEVFEDCSMWNGTPSDWMLVGTRHATGSVSAAHFAKAWAHPTLGSHLREIGFETPEQIGATFMGDSDYLRSLTGDTAPLTDEYPRRLRPIDARLSLFAAPDLDRASAEVYRSVIDPRRARGAFQSSAFIRRFWPETLVQTTLPFFEHQRIVNRVLLEGANPLRQIEALHFLLTETSLRTLPRWLLGIGSSDQQERIAERSDDTTDMAQYILGLRALTERNYPEAAAYLGRSRQGGRRRSLLAYALCLAGKLDAASQLADGVSLGDADEHHFWSWLQTNFAVGPIAR